ncbi:MAG TPA: cold shock domain-containing protein [Candidatus Binatia bacterium]|jgi:tetratricopeptide (TPR) repeat protein/cold shock CspA family protein|nr:cold shock domain-containing protein [Candidatus Binatia bacterium]
MGDVDAILAEVRSLATRGDHHMIVARYGTVDDTPEEETWNSTELLYEIGRAFGMLGNEDKVERYLLRCAELAPRRAAVFHCAIGWYFQRKKKWTKALRWYDRALQSFPTYHLCLFRRGYCLEKLHRPREAAEALSRARAVWDGAGADQRTRGRGVQVQVLFHLSRVLRDLGDFDAATEALDECRVLDADTDPPAIRPEHILACCGELQLRRGDLVGARALFEQARDLDRTSSYVWERIGRVHELQSNTDEAEAAYRHAITLPRGAFAYLALGRLHTQVTTDLPAAAAALAEALRQLPSAEPLVRLELARLQLVCGRPRAAYAQVEQALACRREGGFAEGLRLAAELAERLGLIDAAAGYLRQLARLVADDDVLIKRAAALEQQPPREEPVPPDEALPDALTLLSDSALDTPGRARVVGVVDRFFSDKGFGFVRYGDGQTLFFHVTQCQDGGDGIAPGAPVSFIVGHNPKKGKPQAEAVRRQE